MFFLFLFLEFLQFTFLESLQSSKFQDLHEKSVNARARNNELKKKQKNTTFKERFK